MTFIGQCARCRVTVVDDGQSRVEWSTGMPHDCLALRTLMLDTVTEIALYEDDPAMDWMVAEAAAEWLRA